MILDKFLQITFYLFLIVWFDFPTADMFDTETQYSAEPKKICIQAVQNSRVFELFFL